MVSLPYLQIVFLLFVKFLLLQANASGNYTDHLALLKFKQEITGDPHGILNSWNDSIPFCNWFGITCNSRHHRVTSMILADHNLVGSISPYIGNLSFLRIIDLRDNNLHGGIPHEVGRLFRLQKLILKNNTIDEEVPVSIANCSELKIIHLAINKIAGTVPVELGSLQKLEILSFPKNSLTGKIPSSIGNISTLQMFNVAINNVEGSVPDSIGRLKNLYVLYIGGNRLSGIIPPSVFNITPLEEISAGENQLHGTLPDNMCLNLPNIIKFGFGINRFFGSIPKSFSNCSRLELFDIPFNNFVGKVPTDIGEVQSLSWLSIAVNNLGSNSTDDLAFVTSLTNCSSLQRLDIGLNHFGGTLPSSIANLSTELTQLYMDTNQISGKIPPGLDTLVNLIGLDLEGNSFTGSIPSYFGKLQHLQYLSLAKNRFSGAIPSSLGNLTQLVELFLYANKLEGNIPSSIGNCQMLTCVDLSLNNLNGSIPPQILLLSSLSNYLNLTGNLLFGKLPPEVGKLKNLNKLRVAENNLSGEIPGTIGECQNMEQLYLQGNSFRGTIPSSLASLRGLLVLDLSRNNLSGQIPKDLQNLPFLNYLNLSFNFLEGEVPTGRVFKNASAISLHGNSNLCGGIPELNLPKCPSKAVHKGKSSHFKITIIIVCVVVLVLLIMPAFLFLYRRRSLERKSAPSTSVGEHLTKVSYRDLYRATGGFSAQNLIGSGGFSSVYKGTLVQIEKPVAVKVLDLEKKDATKSFKAECRALRNIKHRNLVKIITYCSTIDYKRNEFKALVYEFMGNGSLETWLHSNFAREDNSGNLSFLHRLNIAIDVASALHYLHDLCETPIVHCDLKPSNVLLDDDMVAHLSDFGMARLFWMNNDLSQCQSSTIGNKGTVGYAAPEYGIGAVASKEGDVYSYGILLLEMFSGRRPTDEMFKEELNLHGFVKAALPDRLMQIIDPSLVPRDVVVQVAGDVDDDNDGLVLEEINNDNHAQMTPDMHKCLLSLLEIGLACSLESPKDRTSMMDVTRKLHLITTDFIGTHRHNGRPRTSLQNN